MQHAFTGVADVLRVEIEGADRASLPETGRRLWAAVAAGTVSETEAETLGDLLASRTAPASVQIRSKNLTIRPSRPTRPKPTESIQRRRRWAAAGYLPPRVAHHFTTGETAALAVIAEHVVKRGSCDLCHGAVAALAGVSVSTVKRAIRAARVIGLVAVRERRVSRFRSDTNILTIVSSAWSAWLQLGPKDGRRGGVQKGHATNTPTNAKTCDSAGRWPSFRKRGGFRNEVGNPSELPAGVRVRGRRTP